MGAGILVRVLVLALVLATVNTVVGVIARTALRDTDYLFKYGGI